MTRNRKEYTLITYLDGKAEVKMTNTEKEYLLDRGDHFFRMGMVDDYLVVENGSAYSLIS